MVVEILIVILAVCGALMLLWCITGLRAGRLCERLEFVHLIPEAQLPEILRSER